MLAFESIPEGGDDDEEGQSGYSGGGYSGNGCLSQGASRQESDGSPSEQASSWGWLPVEGEEEEKGGAAAETAGEASSAGGRAPLFGGDTPEKRLGLGFVSAFGSRAECRCRCLCPSVFCASMCTRAHMQMLEWVCLRLSSSIAQEADHREGAAAPSPVERGAPAPQG